MGRFLSIIWFLTGACLAEYRRVSLLKKDEFEVSLEYLEVASMADRQWLKVRFSNYTKKPIPIQNVSIRLESDYSALGQSDTLPINSGLGKFGPFIPSEGYLNADELSAYAIALLGLAPQAGVAVEGKAHALILLEDDRTVKTPVEGIPFAFTWEHPGEDGLGSMRTWTKELLDHPERESPYLLGAVLTVPEVSRHFSLQELLMARERRDRADSLIAHTHSRTDFDRDTLVAHYLSKLKSGSLLACDDFYYMGTDFWDPSFVQPMVRIYESTEDWAGTSPLRILFRHSEHWHDDVTITERLAKPILKDWGEIPALSPEEARKHERGLRGWADAIEDLALTRHRLLLPMIIPYIEVTDARYPETFRFYGRREDEPPFSRRVCDAALDAYVKIQYGSVRTGYLDLGFPEKFYSGIVNLTDDEMAQWRDRMIRILKARIGNH